MRYYGPGILKLPESVQAFLARCIDLLRAEEASWMATAVRVGFSDQKAYKAAMRRYKQMATPQSEPQIALVAPQHAAWFEQNGIPHKVIDN